MVLFSFSVPRMIPLIFSGQKSQTTRQPRKIRANGKKPYSVGEKMQLYYRSRQKSRCSNCISSKCTITFERRIHKDLSNFPPCDYWSNFFGEAVITSLIHYTNQMLPGMLRTSEDGSEMWMSSIDEVDCGEQIAWATADGFGSFDEADDFFAKQYGTDWAKKDWDCILWNGQQIVRRVA